MGPDYVYRCVHCGHTFTAAQKMCPDCLCRTLTRRVVQDNRSTGIENSRAETDYSPKFTVLD